MLYSTSVGDMFKRLRPSWIVKAPDAGEKRLALMSRLGYIRTAVKRKRTHNAMRTVGTMMKCILDALSFIAFCTCVIFIVLEGILVLDEVLCDLEE